MRHRSILLAYLGAGFVAVSVSACFSEGTTCEEAGTCGGGGVSGNAGNAGAGATSGQGGTSGGGAGGSAGGAGGSAGDGGSCDTGKSPSEEACLVSDEHAVFVSPSGQDGAPGTKTAPLKSVTAAATLAAGGKVVIVCNGTFDEHVTLVAAAKIYGGFDCSSWEYAAGTRPTIAPSSAGYALEIDGVGDPVTIEDITFKSKDGLAASESSVSAFVKASTNVTLRRVELKAGKGVKGSDGVLVPFTYPAQSELDGKHADTTNGGKANACVCPGGAQTSGGAGGNAPGVQGGGGGLPDLGGGQGGQPAGCASGGIGKDGASAGPASDAIGAATSGTLTPAGWSPTNGGNGPNGGPGQGGGGGASSATGGGGGGGCGGCGGAGGPGGTAGGSSIALLSFTSTVTLVDCSLETADAGAGGKGTSGQAAESQFGFNGNGALGGCQGGSGGVGRSGGAGGGGAGGISVAVVYKGDKPQLMNPTIVTGALGARGLGGKPGVNDGVDGVKANELPVP